MASNYLQEGESLSLIAPAGGVVSGTGYMIGGLFVVALTTAAAGAAFTGRTRGVFSMPKASAGSGKAFTAGETLFWDNSNKRFDKTGAGFFAAGVATEDAATTGATVKVMIGRTGATAVA